MKFRTVNEDDDRPRLLSLLKLLLSLTATHFAGNALVLFVIAYSLTGIFFCLFAFKVVETLLKCRA